MMRARVINTETGVAHGVADVSADEDLFAILDRLIGFHLSRLRIETDRDFRVAMENAALKDMEAKGQKLAVVPVENWENMPCDSYRGIELDLFEEEAA